MVTANSQFSPGYTIVLERVRTEVERMDAVRSRSRCFSLYGIHKATGEPQNSEGMERVRNMTIKALDTLVEDNVILSYEIHPKFKGGPEWAFVTLPKRYRKQSVVVDSA